MPRKTHLPAINKGAFAIRIPKHRRRGQYQICCHKPAGPESGRVMPNLRDIALQRVRITEHGTILTYR
jgi:hypothetical protein